MYVLASPLLQTNSSSVVATVEPDPKASLHGAALGEGVVDEGILCSIVDGDQVPASETAAASALVQLLRLNNMYAPQPFVTVCIT